MSGFSIGLLTTGDVGAASKAGLSSAAMGGGLGLTIGVVTTYHDNKVNGLNPITGIPNGSVKLGVMTMQMPDHIGADGSLVSVNRYSTDLGGGGRTTIDFGQTSEPLLLGPSKFPKLQKHFDKHSSEWGPEGTIEIHDYYNQAVNLSEAPIGGDIMGFTSG